MEISERIQIFERLFDELQSTNSRLDKEAIVAEFREDYPELQEDWNYILETIDGKHPIGWTLEIAFDDYRQDQFDTIKSIISYLERVRINTGLNEASIRFAERVLGNYCFFIQPIVNRTLRLGIGKSLLDKTILTPMLAKKYEGKRLSNHISVTEKLDGNRCLASYDGQKWNFTSRSGKPLNVDFDMSGLNNCFVFDGEIMSEVQTQASIERADAIRLSKHIVMDTKDAQLQFNQTSGLINRKGTKTGLVYNIFDIVVDWNYQERRRWLNHCVPESANVRILPTLYIGSNVDMVNLLLDIVCDMGGEGIMLNLYDRKYEHKRSDALLKYKQVQTIDMVVTGLYEGKGKYECMCGGLICTTTTADGRKIYCEVGSGLSDRQRELWWNNMTLIHGKIVEVAYHEMTQDAQSVGTKSYSLRFPRLKRVRTDKNTTSEY